MARAQVPGETPAEQREPSDPSGRRRFFSFETRPPRAETRGLQTIEILGSNPRVTVWHTGLQPGTSLLFPLSGKAFRDHQNVTVERIHIRAPAETHRHLKLLMDHVQCVRDTLLAVGAQPVDIGAADIGALGPHRERLEHVLTRADATVDMHLDLVSNGIKDRPQSPDRRQRAIQLPPTVVRHDDGIRTHVQRFQRGETQIMGVTTLNMLKMEQTIDALHPETTKRYMHHYNFPPYSTGETGRVGTPKRREIGHGALAERALVPVLPKREDFPYAIRQVSEAMGSNGSTSMGSVCASTLSMFNAGVPLRAPVAGIAMGLVSDEVGGETRYAALTDILGAEDALGDMDFKVAGTKSFITAIQLDTKLDGIPASVLGGALSQAKEARLHILDVMNEVIDEPDEMSPYAPRIITVQVPVDKIGEVIGPKGKVINEIQDETGADISIDDDGTVYIGADEGTKAEEAKARINAIANPHVPEVGEQYLGTIVKLAAFGAFISLMPGRDGLLHVSEMKSLSDGKRIENVEDVVSVGQKIQVEIAKIDDRGKLSLKMVEAE